ncbi:hypothetical protein OCH239_21670 [Roseivivax halodurans JCM 10272]|uniref:SH3b domain-containing protein n=1 Tax=Roseivivax halodurans JCM 10272 TaxID=1449350 RepID=X7EHD4_9RHOB|nr:DUF1236 domain-containing protein [Roseivivax halodurans]ETX14616.1 hypothetical protein OCH239_21670 [Roseivivax halodurans JCM 10272]
MTRLRTLALSTAIATVAATPLLAQMSASTTTDLNFRAGPGPQYATQGVIPSDTTVDVTGCLEGGEWCEVTYDGQTGYAYSAYLTTVVEEQPVALYEAPSSVEINTVTYEDDDSAETVGGTAGAAWGAAAGSLLVGGPAAVAAGAIVGAATGAAGADVEENTVTYVQQNPVEPVYLNGEVAVGAGVPQDVEVYSVPEADYQYLNVNQQTVIVDPETRRIVQVIR